jgi:hypothetical protein
MVDWLTDVAIGIALALLTGLLLLTSSFDSTFIYRGF